MAFSSVNYGGGYQNQINPLYLYEQQNLQNNMASLGNMFQQFQNQQKQKSQDDLMTFLAGKDVSNREGLASAMKEWQGVKSANAPQGFWGKLGNAFNPHGQYYGNTDLENNILMEYLKPAMKDPQETRLGEARIAGAELTNQTTSQQNKYREEDRPYQVKKQQQDLEAGGLQMNKARQDTLLDWLTTQENLMSSQQRREQSAGMYPMTQQAARQEIRLRNQEANRQERNDKFNRKLSRQKMKQGESGLNIDQQRLDIEKQRLQGYNLSTLRNYYSDLQSARNDMEYYSSLSTEDKKKLDTSLMAVVQKIDDITGEINGSKGNNNNDPFGIR